jgi:hypothetical protein
MARTSPMAITLAAMVIFATACTDNGANSTSQQSATTPAATASASPPSTTRSVTSSTSSTASVPSTTAAPTTTTTTMPAPPPPVRIEDVLIDPRSAVKRALRAPSSFVRSVSADGTSTPIPGAGPKSPAVPAAIVHAAADEAFVPRGDETLTASVSGWEFPDRAAARRYRTKWNDWFTEDSQTRRDEFSRTTWRRRPITLLGGNWRGAVETTTNQRQFPGSAPESYRRWTARLVRTVGPRVLAVDVTWGVTPPSRPHWRQLVGRLARRQELRAGRVTHREGAGARDLQGRRGLIDELMPWREIASNRSILGDVRGVERGSSTCATRIVFDDGPLDVTVCDYDTPAAASRAWSRLDVRGVVPQQTRFHGEPRDISRIDPELRRAVGRHVNFFDADQRYRPVTIVRALRGPRIYQTAVNEPRRDQSALVAIDVLRRQLRHSRADRS